MAEGSFPGGAVRAVLEGGAVATVRSVYKVDGLRVDAVPFRTVIGECVHVMVQGHGAETWAAKQKLKNAIVGPQRLAIEVFPPESELVDQADVFHLWVLPDGYQLPFGLEET